MHMLFGNLAQLDVSWHLLIATVECVSLYGLLDFKHLSKCVMNEYLSDPACPQVVHLHCLNLPKHIQYRYPTKRTGSRTTFRTCMQSRVDL